MAKSFIGVPSIYPKLLELRKSKTAKFKKNKLMRESTEMRYYQVIGSLHMMLLERMVLGDGTGLGKCVSATTYVPSSKGLLQMGGLAAKFNMVLKGDTLYELPKDFYILSNGSTQRASHLYYSGKAGGIKIRTHKGFELSGLPHHPILSPDNNEIIYKKLEELKIEDYICINRKGLFPEKYYSIDFKYQKSIRPSSLKDYKYPDFLTEDLAELLGYYVSEGSSSGKWAFEISQSYDEIRDRIRFLLDSIFGYRETGNEKNFKTKVIVSSSQIRGLFDYLGVNTGGKSEGQIVPETVLSSKKSVIVSFLRGYFEGDGSVEISNKIVSCSSKSEKLLKQVQILLLQFGIVSRRKKKWVKVKNGKNLYWILYFCGKDVEIFQREIGFVSKRKRDSLKTISLMKRNTNDDIIPIGSALLKQALSDIISHLRELPDQKNFSVKGSGWKGLVGVRYKEKLEKYIYNKRRLTYEGLKEFLGVIESLKLTSVVSNYLFLKDIIYKNIFFDKVVSIEKEVDEYFDLHVPETHNFTGNGFINHNTLQGIAAHSFALDQDESVKLLVVCPKSAKDQWAEEYEKFTTGITTRVVNNKYKKLKGFAARKLQYQEFKENVLIMNYAPVLNEYEMIIDTLSPNFMVIYDECFGYHTPVVMEDGTTKLIGKIVSKKKSVKVLSFNKVTGKIEPKKIINFFRTPSKEWYRIKGKRTNSVICSPTHKFFTSIGEKSASELRVGDTIRGINRGYSETQKQIILGSLLGDGGIRYYKQFIKDRPTGVTMMQSHKRSQYFFFKVRNLSEHTVRISKQKCGWNRQPVWYMFTDKNPILTDFLRELNIVNNRGKKEITMDTLEALTPLGIAIWYCDDGSLGKNLIFLHTQGFTKRENLLIIEYFKKNWEIKFKISEDRKKKLCSLYSCGDDHRKFLELISPYIPLEMNYKTPLSCGSFWKNYDERPFWDTYDDYIEICERKNFSANTFSKYKYNIEVEDNHNYFAGGMLVSNCQAFKNRKSKTNFACKFLADKAARVYGLSATLIKNDLEEVWGVYDVLVPGLFGNITRFKNTFFRQKLMKLEIKGKTRYIPKTTGYKNLVKFKETLDPYFLIRKKEEVASELPKLISKKVVLEMGSEQWSLYRDAVSGILHEERVKNEYFEMYDHIRVCGEDQVDDKTKKKYAELKEKYEVVLTPEGKKRGKLAALTYCQMISNGPGLLNEPGGSSKEEEFIRLMKEELLSEKVIVFTRFKTGIPFLEIQCDRNGIDHTKITGDCDDRERKRARIKFQEDPNCPVIFITTAGSAALNLQAAGVLIFYDTPWSYGDLVQTIGRAQRIGSLQEHILVIHMVNKGTIDEHVINKVSDKKDLSDAVVGDTAEGALDFGKYEGSAVGDLFEELLNDAKGFE